MFHLAIAKVFCLEYLLISVGIFTYFFISEENKTSLQKATLDNDKTSDGIKSESEEKHIDSSGSDGKERTSLQVLDKKKVRPCVKKKKIADEPSIILFSYFEKIILHVYCKYLIFILLGSLKKFQLKY